MIPAGAYKVRQRFTLSTRLDDDLEATHALEGYQLTGSGSGMLARVADAVSETHQRAFTWTGTYGSGKSSLALFLCALLSPLAAVRRRAKTIAGACDFSERMRPGTRGWAVARMVARPGRLENQVRSALLNAACERHDWAAAQSLLDGTVAEAVARIAKKSHGASGGGLLIVIDELGRAFEGGEDSRNNLHFIQDLAEAVNRSEAPAVLIGVLHQAFQDYANSLTRSARDEWSKVQGRFLDIPMAIAAVEVLDLVGDAITGPDASVECVAAAASVAGAMSGVGPFNQLTERLARCWPLHPATALLLGPLSRRRFGQNERSVFSFLCSGEPEGFARYAREGAIGAYSPARLWDYLEVNLESAILASADGHRWSEAADAVERARRRGSALHVEVTKVVGMIDLFGRQASLQASFEMLTAVLAASPEDVTAALEDLRSWSVLVYRGHLGAWAAFAGSDLDVDQTIERMRADVDPGEALRAVLGDFDMPVVAKRHYVETGTLRWFMQRFVPLADLRRYADERQPGDGSFLLAFPEDADGEEAAPATCRSLSLQLASTVVGWAPKGAGGRDAAIELAACARIREQVPAFRGDSVARRELQARELAARERLDALVRGAIESAEWYMGGEPVEGVGTTANEIASRLAYAWYPDAPRIRNELLNRERPSSNAVAARRALMHRMVLSPAAPGLGMSGTPPEMAAYMGLVKASGLHVYDAEEGLWRFAGPSSDGVGSGLMPLWREFHAFLDHAKRGPRPISDLYSRWARRPIGLRAGVAPILALAFMLAEEEGLAFYEGGEFMSHLTDYAVDRLLQDPASVAIRRFGPGALRRTTLDRLAGLASAFARQEFTQVTPLAVVKPLVDFVRGLPPWTRRTRRLDAVAIAVRDAIANARDPVSLLYDELPKLLETGSLDTAASAETFVVKITASLRNLEAAYPKMVCETRDIIISGLLTEARNADDLPGALASRGMAVVGRTGDFRLDAFAQRLGGALSGDEAWVEHLASLAVNKPAREWTDSDLETAKIEISDLVNRFRRVERLLARPGDEGTTVVVNVADPTGIVERAAFFAGRREDADVAATQCAIRNSLDAVGAGRAERALALALALQEVLAAEEDRAAPSARRQVAGKAA